MIERQTDFAYLGDRQYVHGTSILSAFLGLLDGTEARSIVVKRTKFSKPATSNGVLLLGKAGMGGDARAHANATFLAVADGTSWHGAFTEQARPVTRNERPVYPISELKAAAFAGSCRIAPQDRDDLIRGLVEANKRFHEASVEGSARVAVRFGYLEDWSVPGRDVRFSGELVAKNLITRTTADGIMTVNQLSYADGGDRRATLTLCFNVTQAGAS